MEKLSLKLNEFIGSGLQKHGKRTYNYCITWKYRLSDTSMKKTSADVAAKYYQQVSLFTVRKDNLPAEIFLPVKIYLPSNDAGGEFWFRSRLLKD